MATKNATPLGWTKEAIYKFASDLSRELDLQPNEELEPIVEAFGGDVIYQDVFEAERTNDGSIIVEGPDRFKIFVPDYVSRERNRFTIAHEIGHYFLHYLIGTKAQGPFRATRLPPKGQATRSEWEANWFAAAFLMPSTEFIAFARECGGSPVAIARHFGVSLDAVKIHLAYHRDEISASS